ncbi:acyl-CoA thioesterase [Pseudohalocynthiibacter aestuariivivens]|jgi:acyl-CoA thioester hydrolase|uniref:Acyl-CoA thioesterase n=1 Tax=Pseudohalocynthiibacter aestuariivivens TaxID=1591409 RepID=A0ABV5JG42_9RHOB|nr:MULTISPECIES: acyl-CoA thioesterase [Pseudohalocynthiibacter]MBS9716232.1 acyl-CoA thioesterase [Pseudohalocynthiibacter aestuariivivens]MCK0100961.1 acyl-CoA thioesterase [Pseudohalocynthiibacter sp. F2068]
MTLPYHTPLSPETLAAHGIPPEWRYALANKVQFFELDALNHVNNTVYLRWFESFRLSYVMDYGISDFGPMSPRLVVHSLSARFHKEMHLGDDYIVAGRTTSFRNTSFIMEYALFSNGLAATGDAVMVLLNREGDGRHPLTEAQKKALIERDGAKADAG